MTRPTEWAPGLVALHYCRGGHFAIRTAENMRRWIASCYMWESDANEDPWCNNAGAWPAVPVWVGTPQDRRTLHSESGNPADLLATAERLTSAAKAAEAEIHAMSERTLRAESNAGYKTLSQAADALGCSPANVPREAHAVVAERDALRATLAEASTDAFERGRVEGMADVSARLRAVIDPEDRHRLDLDGLLAEAARFKREVSNYRSIVDEALDTIRDDTQEIDDLKAQIRDLEARLATVHVLTSPPAPEAETIDRLEDAREGGFYRDANGVLFYAGRRTVVSRHACAVHDGWHFEPALPARFVQQGQPGANWWMEVKDEAARLGLV